MAATLSPLLKVKERIIGPSGIYNVQNEWYGYADDFKYTIGLPGLMGFGVGCCPPELLPSDMALLPGTEDRFSANYGTYIHLPSASIVCFIPAHYIDVQAPGNTNAPTYGTKIVISSTQSGNGVLPQAFQNNSGNLAGVFVDKYLGSNCLADGSGLPNSSDGAAGTLPSSGGIFASRPLHWPVGAANKDSSGTDTNSPFSFCNSTALNGAATTPADNLGGIWKLVKTRGADFAPCPIWVYTQLGFLSLAHAQALLDNTGTPISGATTNAAWMDTAPYAPKGNNNNGSDVNKSSLQFARTDIAGNASGYAGRSARSFTGAARISGAAAVEHTTHNGQLSGIVDLNGNMWEIATGLTNNTSTNAGYKLFPTSADWTATTGNGSITGAAGVVSLSAESSAGADDGIWHTADNAWTYLKEDVGGTFHDDLLNSSATLRAMTECGIPREAGTSTTQTSTNIFGGDGLYQAHRSDLVPRVGGDWADGARAGVFYRNLDRGSSDTGSAAGARAVRLLSP